MLKVSIVSPNYQVGPKHCHSWYLPYSAGVLWSHAYTSEIVQQNYELNKLVWRRDDVEELAQILSKDSVVGFSNYIWNWKYNNGLAKRVKELNPECLIIFGGVQVPITDPEIFIKYPYIDICVKSEGEYVFKNILETHVHDKDFAQIKGILYNDRNRLTSSLIDTGDAIRIENLDNIPSPYLTGLFDDIIAENPDVNWSGMFESNRGCPYKCTFCDWGSLTFSKVKKFDIDRTLAELEWAAKNKIEFLYLSDANFGMFFERDMAIAEKIVEMVKATGYPKATHMTWAKNSKRDVIKIAERLNANGVPHPMYISVQSLNEHTLEIIERKNMEMSQIGEMFQLCQENNLPTFTEVICGLPSETLDTWKQNFYGLYDVNNHEGIAVYQCAVLENAEMNLTQVEKYGIEKVAVSDYITGSEYDNSEFKEVVDVVTATDTMPRSDMVEAQLFSWYQNTFHIKGLTNYIARFLNKAVDLSYSQFYEKFWVYINDHEWCSNEIVSLRSIYKDWFDTGTRIHKNVGDVPISAMNLVLISVIKMHQEERYDEIHSLIEDFVRTEFGDLLPSDLINDLLSVQRNNIVEYKHLKNDPIRENYDYDILGYIINDSELKNPVEYVFGHGSLSQSDLSENDQSIYNKTIFMERLWFFKRYNAGVAQIYRKDLTEKEHYKIES